MSFEGRVKAATEQPLELRLASPAIFIAWAIPALLTLAAIVQQSVIGLDADVSWLIIVGEKVLDGQRLYVDIFEVNPPASVWIYLPGIVAARALSITPELATAVLTFFLAAISFGSSGRLLHRAGLLGRERIPQTLSAAIFAFLLLPGACFAQREHIAVLTLLPFIALLTVRLEGERVALSAPLLAGIGAGVTIAIKPHFVLAIAPMILLLMWRRRSIAAGLGVESWAAAGVALAYAIAVVWFYPVFVNEALPLLRAVYLPSRNGFAEVWLSPATFMFFVASVLALFLVRGKAVRTVAIFNLLAAFGFAAAMGVQGKGYLNHCYPFVSLAIFALGLILVQQQGYRAEKIFGRSLLAMLAASSSYVFAQAESYPQLAQLVRRVAPQHPRMIAAGSNLSVGHPLTRWVGGEWVGRRGALWATGTAVALMDKESDKQRAVLQAYIDDDRRIFVEDVERGAPDVILVPGDIGRQWIAANADVSRATAGYRSAGTAQGVTVMVRAAKTTPSNPG